MQDFFIACTDKYNLY